MYTRALQHSTYTCLCYVPGLGTPMKTIIEEDVKSTSATSDEASFLAASRYTIHSSHSPHASIRNSGQRLYSSQGSDSGGVGGHNSDRTFFDASPLLGEKEGLAGTTDHTVMSRAYILASNYVRLWLAVQEV